MARYKFIVHIVIGEKRGEGVRMATRCFYDADTDNVAHETFVNVCVICLFVFWIGGFSIVCRSLFFVWLPVSSL